MAVRFPLVPQKVFGASAGSNRIAKFGSFATGTPAFTTDPAQVQSLSNFDQGWDGAVVGQNSPAIEDVNAVDFLLSRQIAYLQQLGIPEWSSTTTYYIGSLVQDGYGNVYASLADNNLNNFVTSTGSWAAVIGNAGVPGYLKGGFGDINSNAIGYSAASALGSNVAMTSGATVVPIMSMSIPEGYWTIEAVVAMSFAGLSGGQYLQQLQLGINNSNTSMNTTGCYLVEYPGSQYTAATSLIKRFSSDPILVPKTATYTYYLLGTTVFSGGTPASSVYQATYTKMTRRRIG